MVGTPVGQFRQRIAWGQREFFGRDAYTVRPNSFEQECAFTTEQPKDRDFINTRFFGNATRGCATKAMRTIQAGCGRQEMLSCRSGHASAIPIKGSAYPQGDDPLLNLGTP